MKTKLFSLCLLIAAITLSSGCHKQKKDIDLLQRTDWSEDVKQGVNDFLHRYTQTKNAYVVFDFDNTSSIFDVEEQALVYQIMTMAYGVDAEDMDDVLSAGIGDLDTPRKSFSQDGVMHTYREWITDIHNSYGYLYEKYGPFKGEGLSEQKQKELQSDDMWKEFSVKMRIMYDLLCAEESNDVAYPWLLYLFSGMTEQQVYDMAYKSHSHFKELQTERITWTSPVSVSSVVGAASFTWTSGIQVSENIKELYKALHNNGIDVWICSASITDAIRAAIDVFGLHDYCTGVIAMTISKKDGKYIPEYDYQSGYEWFATSTGWERGNVASKTQTQSEGKVTAIRNVLFPKYGCGPMGGFMDSTGDFNFCTEFKNLKIVICFNRADRKVTDGGGLVAEVAMYQKETLDYTLDKANDAGDTFYLLQGRDENGLRSFRNSPKTMKFSQTQEKLFASEDNQTCLDYMKSMKLTTKQALEKFSHKTPAGEFPFAYGFMDNYVGYHYY